MRKANKIMMAIVAILLSLVLFTTCILSGVFAKYAISRDRKVVLGIDEFGVTLEAWLDDDFKAYLAETYPDTDYDTIVENLSATDESLKLKVELGTFDVFPGIDFSEAIHFKISGTAKVPLKLSIVPYLSVTTARFEVPTGVAGLAATTKFFPLGFTCGAKKSTNAYGITDTCKPWLTGSAFTSAEAENAIADGLVSMFDVKLDTSGADDCVYKKFDVNTPIVLHPKDSSGKVYNGENGTTRIDVSEFALGFYWPLEYEDHATYSKEELNEIEVAMSKNGKDKTTSFGYTVIIEQLQSYS